MFRPLYVRTFYVPKFGGLWNHRLTARALREPIRRVRAEFPFDAVLGAWVYPDACALELLAEELCAPLVAIAQGTDVHSYLHMPLRRHAIVQALSALRPPSPAAATLPPGCARPACRS